MRRALRMHLPCSSTDIVNSTVAGTTLPLLRQLVRSCSSKRTLLGRPWRLTGAADIIAWAVSTTPLSDRRGTSRATRDLLGHAGRGDNAGTALAGRDFRAPAAARRATRPAYNIIDRLGLATYIMRLRADLARLRNRVAGCLAALDQLNDPRHCAPSAPSWLSYATQRPSASSIACASRRLTYRVDRARLLLRSADASKAHCVSSLWLHAAPGRRRLIVVFPQSAVFQFSSFAIGAVLAGENLPPNATV